MYTLTKDIIPGYVVWANRKCYYDKPKEKIEGKKSMFLITVVNEDHVLGSPLTRNNTARNRTVLDKLHYPIKFNSRITEDLYALKKDDIIGDNHFIVKEKTLEHFKRCIHQRIVIDQMVSPKVYSEIFEEDYLKDHYPKKDDIVAYTSKDRVFKFYYIYDEDEKNYFGVRLDRSSYVHYWVADPTIKTISKSDTYYDYYDNGIISRNEVEKSLIKRM